ncbi:hypothetical protein [Methylocella tundrae]|uniref:hypothetical protein n=1 Tax=Methylocella tundrae TaxID=227605 RepID=UPI001FCE74BB|nr:hypothetical protein [Methylocella tundrae]
MFLDDLSAHVYGDERIAGERRDGPVASLLFRLRQQQIPIFWIIEIRRAYLGDRARQAVALIFNEAGVRFNLIDLQRLCERHPDEAREAAKAEKQKVAQDRQSPAPWNKINQRFRAKRPKARPQSPNIPDRTHLDWIVDDAVDQARLAKDQFERGRFRRDGNIGQDIAFRIGKHFGQFVKRWQSNDGVAEAADPIDQNAFDRLLRCGDAPFL